MAKPSKAPSRKALLAEWLAARNPHSVDSAAVAELESDLAPVSRPYLRRILRDSGWPLDPLVEGVRQDSLESLARTLCNLALAYEAGHTKQARALVLEAKDHAKLAARRGKDKDEMLLWMIVWLENPVAFPMWHKLRERKLTAKRPSAPE